MSYVPRWGRGYVVLTPLKKCTYGSSQAAFRVWSADLVLFTALMCATFSLYTLWALGEILFAGVAAHWVCALSAPSIFRYRSTLITTLEWIFRAIFLTPLHHD